MNTMQDFREAGEITGLAMAVGAHTIACAKMKWAWGQMRDAKTPERRAEISLTFRAGYDTMRRKYS